MGDRVRSKIRGHHHPNAGVRKARSPHAYERSTPACGRLGRFEEGTLQALALSSKQGFSVSRHSLMPHCLELKVSDSLEEMLRCESEMLKLNT